MCEVVAPGWTRVPSLQNPDVAKVRGECCRSFAWTDQVPVADAAGELHHPRCPTVRTPTGKPTA